MTLTRYLAIVAATAAAAALLTPGIAHAGLLSKAGFGGGSSSASAIDLGGAVQVSRSQSSSGGARWDAVVIGGQSLLGRESSTGGAQNQWTGALAPAGAVVDAVNGAFCPAGSQSCLSVLHAGSGAENFDGFTESGAGGSVASLWLTQGDAATGVAVGSSGASHFGFGSCGSGFSGSELVVVAADGSAQRIDPSDAEGSDCR